MLRLVPDGGDADRRAGEALQDILAPMLEDLTGRRLRRHQRAEADLRACIEVTGAQHLDDEERVLLELERSIDPTGAVARIAPAEVLLLVLPSFLEDPRWDGEDDIDRKVRIDLMLAIARWCVRLPELRDVDTDDAMEDVLDACGSRTGGSGSTRPVGRASGWTPRSARCSTTSWSAMASLVPTTAPDLLRRRHSAVRRG